MYQTRPYLQALFLGSNQLNLSLSLQKPICLHYLYMQYTQPVTAFIRNDKVIDEHKEVLAESSVTYFSKY